MQPFVSIQGLQISFPAQHVPAVAGISFDIYPGECVAIIGESGSGKSMTALALNGLLPPQAKMDGKIIYHTLPGQTFAPELRGKTTGNIFQDPMQALNPVYSCGFQVMEAIQQHQPCSRKEAEQRAIQLFADVELPNPSGILNRYPHELSGGQQQRVMIAMAICNQPDLLIADEPTTALDLAIQHEILQLIHRLRHTYGMAVLLISHNLQMVESYADRLLIMQQGHIVESGKTQDIITHPAHAYTKSLWLSRPTFTSKGKTLPSAGQPEPETLSIIPTLNPEDVLMEVQHLTKVYRERKRMFGQKANEITAVNDVSFTIRRNEILGVVGESGCGKSTLGRMLLQLTEPSGGSVRLNGTDLTQCSRRELRKLRSQMQMVFQNPYASLNPQMTLYEILYEPLLLHTSLSPAQKKERILELVHQVQLLPEHITRYPHQFSGGQRQRIAIARALATHPAFIVFDESVSALDVRVQASILNLIQQLRRQYAFSALFISHDLSVVHYISDRILVMQNGRVVEINEANALFRSPVEPYTQKLLRSAMH
ncbi:MAG TPA: ABC transporter ATP-binding protein [Ferruginibacter sp.]|nr:ABC transporter ATP-binding protein [Ferruginibacter sp.]